MSRVAWRHDGSMIVHLRARSWEIAAEHLAALRTEFRPPGYRLDGVVLQPHPRGGQRVRVGAIYRASSNAPRALEGNVSAIKEFFAPWEEAARGSGRSPASPTDDPSPGESSSTPTP